MNDSRYTKFIEGLTRDLSPLVLYWTAEKRAFFWILIHSLWISILMNIIRPYIYIEKQGYSQVFFYFEVATFVISICLAVYFSFLSITPGAIKVKRLKFTIVPIFILLSYFLYGAFFLPPGNMNAGMRNFCELEIMAYALVPTIHIIYLAKKGAYYNKKWTFICAGFAASLIPALLMHFACMYDYKHILIFHMGPVLFITGVIAFLMSREV